MHRLRPTPLALCLALVACRDPRVVSADDPRVRYEARTLTDWRGRVRFAWPRSAVHLRFRGTGLAARLTDTPYEDSLRDTDIVGVEVDGGPMRHIALREGAHTYALARNLAPGEHTLRLVKLTEAEVGTVRVDALTVSDGGALLAAAPAPRRRMLAVGDSITAGYGVNGPDAACGYGAAYNDASRAWVSRAADALGAELHMIAWSGRGVLRNYDPAVRETLPDVFALPVPTEPEAHCDLRAWRFTDVVINVGTNDTSRAGFDAQRFERALVAFVRRLRALYPAARVVLAVGPMLNERGPGADCYPRAQVLAAATAAAEAERRRGPCEVSVLELPRATDDEGYGCSSHPSERTHARMAAQLVAHLAAHERQASRESQH